MTDSRPRTLLKILNNEHKHSLVSGLQELWANNCYVDTVLVGRNKSGFGNVQVNKLYLATVSHKFAHLLSETEGKINIIFPDTDIQVLLYFVNFIYSGQIIINTAGNSLALELLSFLSEWNVQYTKLLPEQESSLVNELSAVNSFSNPKLQNLVVDSELTALPAESSDQAAKFDKLFCRSYSKKKKILKPLLRFEIIPELTNKEDLINLEDTVETQVITHDFSGDTHMGVVNEDIAETFPEDTLDIFNNPQNLNEGEKSPSLLGMLTGETALNSVNNNHEFNAATNPNNSTEVSKPNSIPCKTCGKEINLRYMASHEKIHAGERPYLCELCGATFVLPDNLRKHKRFTHESSLLPLHTCNVCGKSFKKVSHLKHHETLHRTPRQSYTCNICGTIFHQNYIYLTHMAAHNGEVPKLPCRHCSETFATYKLVKSHLQEKHADTLFMCDQCPNFFTSQTALKNHKAAHKEGKQQRCNICVRTFPTKEELEGHNKSCHVNDTPLTCNVCDKVLKSVGTLRTHLRMHTDERPYQCPHCPKAFRLKPHLSNHIRTHTGEKPFVCSVCDKAFGNDNNLRVHMKLHTGQKIECKQCNKVFRSFVKLKEHQDAHPTEGGLYCASPASASMSESNR